MCVSQPCNRIRSQQLYLRPRTRGANTVFDVVSPLSHPARSLLAALACFALAGLVDGPLSATPRVVLALSATVAGVYATARYARSVDRLSLARTSIGLWVGVVASSVVVAVGEAAGYGPVSAGITEATVRTATWAALLAAGATTSFLGFREYGGRAGAPATVEGEIDYRTR